MGPSRGGGCVLSFTRVVNVVIASVAVAVPKIVSRYDPIFAAVGSSSNSLHRVGSVDFDEVVFDQVRDGHVVYRCSGGCQSSCDLLLSGPVPPVRSSAMLTLIPFVAAIARAVLNVVSVSFQLDI